MDVNQSNVEESAADWIRERIGCRCLVRGTDQVWESTIMELSPCENYVRLNTAYLHGKDYGWMPVEEVRQHILCIWPKEVEA